jgi:hypothetical protein
LASIKGSVIQVIKNQMGSSIIKNAMALLFIAAPAKAHTFCTELPLCGKLGFQIFHAAGFEYFVIPGRVSAPPEHRETKRLSVSC